MLNRLHQHARSFADQINRFGCGGKQTVGKRDHFICCGDQPEQRASSGDDMELRAAALGDVLQRDDIRGQRGGEADDPLAVECQGDAELLARYSQTSDAQQRARNWAIRGRFQE